MTTCKVIGTLVHMVLGGIALSGLFTSAWAARAIQGSVGQVSPTDGAVLGPVGFRIWSGLSGGESSINDNVSSCRNVRCMRSYVTITALDPGGYLGNQEATQVYNVDVTGQPFYQLVDASMNDAAGNHIGFFGVSGVSADNSGVGNFLAANCPPPTATNCFGRIDSDDAGAILFNTQASYGAGPNEIRPISGLNPIPTVNATLTCTSGSICLSWNDPPTYAGNMRPGTVAPAPPSPVKGVRLYKQFRADCLDPSGDDPNWAPASLPAHPDGRFDLGDTSIQDAVPPQGGCNLYALTVRLVGPGGDANEVETFRIGAHTKIGGGCEGVVCQAFDACHVAGVCDPRTGTCTNPPAPDGTVCDDRNGCTQTDSCQAGICTGNPVTCTPLDQCHIAGTCDSQTGTCSNPAAPNGTGCNDGTACTQTDSCEAGVCTGSNPVTCTPIDQCQLAVCDAATGACTNAAAPDGAGCDDGNACTRTDSCRAGVCTGSAVPDGTGCNDADACTRTDSCQAGVCTGTNPVICTRLDSCHVAGVCNAGSGTCSNPTAPDGTGCDDANVCTLADSCQAGVCSGSAAPDGTGCNDANACTPIDSCQAVVCTGVAAPDGTICDDGNACSTNDACTAGHCVGQGVTTLPFLDTFSGPGLDACWTFVDPVGDATYDVDSGHLDLRAPAGTSHDCWNSAPNCTRAVRPVPDEDTVYETEFDGQALTAANQDYGIVLLQDDCNYIRFEYWTAGAGVYVRAYRVIGCAGQLPPAISTVAPVGLGAANALRVTRSGDLFGLDYRLDSGPWTMVGFLTQPGFIVEQAGLFANDAVGNPATVASADYFSAVRPAAVHEIRFLTGPSGIPSVTPSGGSVRLDVAAEDTQGHVLGYHWVSSCSSLGANGSFDPGPDMPSPRWTAPVNDTGSIVACTLSVSVEDGAGGLSRTASYQQRVDTSAHALEITNLSVSPNPVPSGGIAQLSATVLDSFGHAVVLAWSSSCGAGLGSGSFSDPSAGSTIWTAPANTTAGPVDCTLTLIVIDSTVERVTSRSLTETVQSEDGFEVLFRDDFTDGLAPGWSLHDPSGDALFASVPGHVAIGVPAGSTHDCWSNGLGCVLLTRTFSDTNVVFETSIDGAGVGAGNQDYGIILLDRSSNFLRFEYWSGGSGVYVRAYRVDHGRGVLPPKASTPAPVALGASNALRVTKVGDTFTLQYKIDDGAWTTVGTFEETGFTLREAGVFVNNAVGNPLTSGYFDDFSASVPPSPFAAASEEEAGSSEAVPPEEPAATPRSQRIR